MCRIVVVTLLTPVSAVLYSACSKIIKNNSSCTYLPKMRQVNMSTVYHYQGRGYLASTKSPSPQVIQSDPGTIFWIVGHGQPRTNIAFCRMFIFDTWGIFVANPFRRYDDHYTRRTYAEYLPQDIFLYHEVHIYTVPEESWMYREV